MKPDVKPCKFLDETAKFMNYSTQFLHWYDTNRQFHNGTFQMAPARCYKLFRTWKVVGTETQTGKSRLEQT